MCCVKPKRWSPRRELFITAQSTVITFNQTITWFGLFFLLFFFGGEPLLSVAVYNYKIRDLVLCSCILYFCSALVVGCILGSTVVKRDSNNKINNFIMAVRTGGHNYMLFRFLGL